ncbi:MAG: O-succinylbenzoic acid--CoA ligase [Bacteroidetes bacterium MedPE-SWsnd-G2]|nr:MAG: O-succinylbenzoic acid--CoA ligase [Bacteroidetes bacterium MedPE-SWsnd-G2]
MIPKYNKIHLKFKMNGVSLDHDSIPEVAYSCVKEGEPFEKSLGAFLLDWLDEGPTIGVLTSGSTGEQKTIQVSKQAMVNSSIVTGDYFKLEPGDSALHCLPTTHIAGKMMVVRAMMLGLELDVVEPKLNPEFKADKTYSFCAMVPAQLSNCLGKLNNIETLIVGGAAVNAQLLDEIQGLSTKVCATYGMTETVSHIALKPLNYGSESAHFTCLAGITISKDERSCLVIDAPKLSAEQIITNDIVEIYENNTFEVLGRFDNMINSGGLKYFPEKIEAKLEGKLPCRYFITSEPDQVLGEQIVLVLEGESVIVDDSIYGKEFGKFEIPKKTYNVSKFVETPTGKIQRKKTVELIKKGAN